MSGHKKLTLAAAPLALALLFYVGFLNHVEPSEAGIAKNLATGELWLQGSGWHVTPPWVLVANVDTRPMRVSVSSAGRGYGAKLVHFVPERYREFVEVEGFRYYWWANRISFNFGHEEEYRGFRDIARGYAYGARTYPFFEILEEYAH
jgi:hypothetical protein